MSAPLDPRATRVGGATRIASDPRRPVGLSSRLGVDRVACTGHGVCAQLLAQVRLDEFGYPIVEGAAVDPDEAAPAIALCPARALFLMPPR
ncbi:3Fe-4S ferredoxin [Intrasporangium oryzae NRRL B-24470]|uniref:3Fe-4S ferredoxin n=1 Tax=Intrasporangium oryzae NRRL B-24470 TaxID=1386089 RepID=W9GBR4_9MICO|nr:hypothetical protein [Intrasporangium oryzae]EWT01309.1 3Fe-4S ferredoxin [Intrasporangium oryzae NRRL B-24470]